MDKSLKQELLLLMTVSKLDEKEFFKLVKNSKDVKISNKIINNIYKKYRELEFEINHVYGIFLEDKYLHVSDEDYKMYEKVVMLKNQLIDDQKVLVKMAATLAKENIVNLNKQDFTGNTILMRAAEDGEVDFVKALLKGNNDLSLKNKDGKTAKDLATNSINSHQIISLLEKQNDEELEIN